MKKITELYKTTDTLGEDLLIVQQSSGTKAITKNDLFKEVNLELSNKINFTVDNTNNLEIPLVDEKLDIVNTNYNNLKQFIDANEADKNNSENIRKANETNRINAESTRGVNETTRVNAEATRITNENTRTSNETTRASSENTRAANENTRVSNENTRISKETARISAETSRATAETNRVNAEALRATAENTRGANETTRANAETTRIANEAARQTVYKEVEENRKDYNNKVYANMYEARKADYERLDNKFGDFTHSRFSGVGNFKADNTKEGLIKDFNIKGRTLQNLLYGNKVINYTSTVGYDGWNPLNKTKEAIKPSTIYTVILNVEKFNGTGSYNINQGTWDNCLFNVNMPINSTGIKKFVATSVSDITNVSIILRCQNTDSKAEIKVTNFILLEGDYTNTPLSEIPFVEGIKSVGENEINGDGKCPIKVKSCGKNLYNNHKDKSLTYGVSEISENYLKTNILAAYGTFGLVNAIYSPNQNILKYSVPIVKDKTYSYSCKIKRIDGTGTLNYFSFFGFNKGSDYFNVGLDNTSYTPSTVDLPLNIWVEFKFTKTATKNSDCIVPCFQVSSSSSNLVLEVKDILLEENTTATTYEQYQEDNIEYLLDEPLRALPNGVCDEIADNKLTRRVGKLVLNGSESWIIQNTPSSGNCTVAILNYNGGKAISDLAEISFVSDKFMYAKLNTIVNVGGNPFGSGVCNAEFISKHNTLSQLALSILDSKLTTQDLTGFRQWLSQNPTTVYYELATPIVTDISVKTLKAYNGTTNVFMNNLLVGEISAKVPTDLVTEIEANRKDFKGNVYPNMYEARINDTAYLLDKINNAEYLEYIGTNITANNSYDGVVKDLSIKGKTLQNLFRFANKTQGVQTYQDGVLTITSDGLNYPTINLGSLSLMKPNTVYTLIFEVVENNLQNSVILRIGDTSDSSKLIDIGTFSYMTKGIQKKVITSPNSSIFNVESFTRPTDASGAKGVFKNFIILEGDYTNTPLSEIPYVEGIKSVGELENKVTVKSCGKNLFNTKLESGRYTIAQGTAIEDINSTRTVSKTKVKPNTNYTLNTGSVELYNISEYQDNTFIETKLTKNFITNGKTNCIHISLKTSNLSTNIQLEENTTATTYEPYQETKQELTLTEPLRSLPNGVCDEIIGDKLTKRVGKVVFDGNSNFGVDSGTIPTSAKVRFSIRIVGKTLNYNTGNLICSNLKVINNPKIDASTPILPSIYDTFSDWLYIDVAPTSCSINLTDDNNTMVSKFKTWLASNITTVYYELATPIITTISPLILQSFDSTTHITSDNYLSPKITAKVPSNVQAVVTNLMNENEELNNQISAMSLESEENSLTNIETNINNDVRLTMLELGL